MKKIIKHLFVLFLVLSITFCAIGCGKEKESTLEKANEQVLHLTFPPTNLVTNYDFHHPWRDSGLFYSLVYSTLLQADKDLKVAQPEIMKSWSVSSDGLTISMTLDENYKWSDGTNIKMEDIVWTFEMLCSKYNANYWAYVVAALKYIEGYEDFRSEKVDNIKGITTEGNTITIKLTTPYTSFIDLMCQIAPLPKHVYGDIDEANFSVDEIWHNLDVVSGMFIVKEHVEGSYYILEQNPEYIGKKPIITKVIGTVSQSNAVAAQAGSADYFQTDSVEDYELMQTLNGYKLDVVPILYYRFLGFNFFDSEGNKKPYVTDPRVRQAFAYAIDWNTLIGSLYGDQASFTQTGVLANNKNYAGDWYEYNPTKAKQLLDEAGYDYNHVIKIFYYYADSITKDVMDGIIYYMKEVGVTVNAVYTTNTSVDVYNGKTQDMTYWGLSAYDELSWYQQYTRATTPGFFGSEALEVYKEKLGELETAYSADLLKAALDDLQELEKNDCFYIPVYTLNYQAWSNKKLILPENALGNGYFYFDYQFEDWYFTK